MIPSHVSGPLALVATVGLLAGCASSGLHVNVPALDLAQPAINRAQFFQGDTFSFDDKVSGKASTYVVESATDRTVRWQGAPRTVLETSTEPPLPWMRLRTETVQIDRKLVQGSVFPLRPGRRDIQLEVDTRIAQQGEATLSFRESYACEAGAWESLTTPAGTFRAIPIQCNKTIAGNFPDSGFVSFFAGKTISWFAPDAGHVVRHVELDKRLSTTKDLMLTNHRASLSALPEDQRHRVTRELAAFAQNPPKGGEKTWHFPASNVELTAKMDDLGSAKPTACRPYTIEIIRAGSKQVLHRQTCA